MIETKKPETTMPTVPMHRVAVIFHYPATSLQDKLIQILIGKKYRREFLHISVSFDDDCYTWTSRGLEVLDINQADVHSINWIYVNDLEPYQIRAFSMCEENVTLLTLLWVKCGQRGNTCASLVSRVVWGEYLPYPAQVMNRIQEDGVWF
jgi:hypothetical protein